MASLTETSIVARRVIRYGVYAVILIIIGRYTYIAGRALYKHFFPPPPTPPNCKFGNQLVNIAFPPNEVPKKYNFTLQTPEGSLPTLPDQTKVYFMQPFSASLGDLDKAKDKARSLGFNPNGNIVVENVPNVYVFEKDGDPSTLTMNIINGIFSINYDLPSSPTSLQTINTTPESAVSVAKSILAKANSTTKDLDEGPTTSQLLKMDSNGKFVKADALVDATAIKVNIFRKSYDDFPSVTSEADQANVWFILGGTSANQIIRGEYNYFPIDDQNYGTYPLFSANDTWEKLKNGEAFIANTGSYKENDNITIRRVYLGYYDPRLYMEYFQPVIVFDEAKEGGNSFVAYVPAVNVEKCPK